MVEFVDFRPKGIEVQFTHVTSIHGVSDTWCQTPKKSHTEALMGVATSVRTGGWLFGLKTMRFVAIPFLSRELSVCLRLGTSSYSQSKQEHRERLMLLRSSTLRR